MDNKLKYIRRGLLASPINVMKNLSYGDKYHVIFCEFHKEAPLRANACDKGGNGGATKLKKVWWSSEVES